MFTAILFALAGLGMGASSVMQSVMIADCVDYDEHRTGYRPDGIFFSGQSFVTKLGAGISSFIQGIVFDASADEQNPWFLAYDLDWDVSNDTPVDEETANAILETNRIHYTALEYFPYIYY